MKDSLIMFNEYIRSDNSLLHWVNVKREWNEEAFIKMVYLIQNVEEDYQNEYYYPKQFIKYFDDEIPKLINSIYGISVCVQYNKETYMAMIEDKQQQLNRLYWGFFRTLDMDWNNKDFSMKDSVIHFYEYYISEEELLYWIRSNAGWNEDIFIKFKEIAIELIKDFENEDYYPKLIVNYFMHIIPSILNIISHYKCCSEKEYLEGYTDETYIIMIKDRVEQLKELGKKFSNSLYSI